VRMGAFGTILIVICVVAVVVAAISFYGSGRIYKGLGRSGVFSMEDEDEDARPAAKPPAAPASPTDPVAQEEIRQMLEAKSARREARGEAPLDVDAELKSLSSPSPQADPALREEVRQLVEARNERRLRQGKEPLDVDAEVERQLRELT
jgi:hypothetical protein